MLKIRIYNFEMIVFEMIITSHSLRMRSSKKYLVWPIMTQNGAHVVEMWRSQTTKVMKIQF